MISKLSVSIVVLVLAFLAALSMILVRAVPPPPNYGPYSGAILFNTVMGYDAQLNALLEGLKDVGPVPRPQDIDTLDMAGFTIPAMTRLGMDPLYQNNAIYPCNDLAFRKAVNRLVDKAKIAELYYPLRSPMEYWLPPSMGEWVNTETLLPTFNPGMPDDSGTGSAYSWLNDNGYTMTNVPNPWATEPWASPYLRTWPGATNPATEVMPEFEYTTTYASASPLYYEQSTIINDVLHQAGINSHLVPTSLIGILLKIMDSDYSMLTGVGFIWGAAEPAIQYYLYHSSSTPLWNVWAYSNPEMDAACEAIMSTLNYDELKDATMLTQQILAEDEPMFPVMMYNTFSAFKSDLLGIVNMQSHGAQGSRNMWTKTLIRKETGEPIKWMLTELMEYNLNPLTTSSSSNWQILELIIGRGGQRNPYTLAYMPWTLASEPTQEAWTGPGGEQGAHMYFELQQGLEWHDGTLVTAADAVFGLNLMRFQEVENYQSIWEPIYDVVQTGTYTLEVWYLQRYFFAARDVGDVCFLTPEHIWEPFIQPTVDAGAGPMGGDVWTNWLNWYYNWHGWMNSLGPDTYNGYPEYDLTELIGLGPYIYHLGALEIDHCHVEANPFFMTTGEPDGLRICVGDVNFDQYCDGLDVWHVLKRIGHREWIDLWYEYLGSDPPLQGPSVDIAFPAQIIDFTEISLMQLHTGHWWGVGDPPLGWTKEPPS